MVAKDEKFSQEETQRRFEAALRGARVSGHKEKSEIGTTARAKKIAAPRKARRQSKSDD